MGNLNFEPKGELKKELITPQLWPMAVGQVISGEYFGWNYGWGAAGPVGCLVATLVVTVLCVTFIFCFMELTMVISQVGGGFVYSHLASGKWGGFVAGYSTLVEFLFMPPVIAFALSTYGHFLYPQLLVMHTARRLFHFHGDEFAGDRVVDQLSAGGGGLQLYHKYAWDR